MDCPDTPLDYPAGSASPSPRPAGLNRLADEASPYLLQHARNPVDWHPWGSEAIECARREDKPIFLSIGYAACHWCHVMERESFEDPAAARILNEFFIPIKVDREVRPDIDAIYMTAVQILTGRGGWPLSVFLTPSLEPFYGGTYFPPQPLHGLPGFQQLLTEVAGWWGRRRGEVESAARRLAAAVAAQDRPAPGPPRPRGGLSASLPAAAENPLQDLVRRAVEGLEAEFDPTDGGFGPAPKFPPANALSLLLAQWWKSGRPGAPESVLRTLDRMAAGGICDQAGGGFHRYSTDARWLVPHFEKMLYDNAQLAGIYTEAWLATGRSLYRRVACETLDYVLRDLADPAGGFHSSEDADSDGGEGRFYLWTPDEVRAVLGAERGDALCRRLDCTAAGNFEGRSILHWAEGEPSDRSEEDSPGAALRADLERLRIARAQRPRPARDDKVVAAWNGLLLQSLSRAAEAFDEMRYLEAARRNAEFLLTEMVGADGLFRSWRRGRAQQPGFLDDYAEVIGGLVALHEADADPRWIRAAADLARRMVDRFGEEAVPADRPDSPSPVDEEPEAAFHYTERGAPDLLTRSRPFYDGPTPSGNAAAVRALLRLGAQPGQADFARRGEAVVRGQVSRLAAFPRAHLDLLRTVAEYLLPDPLEVTVSGPPGDSRTRAFLAEIRSRYLPGRTLVFEDPPAPAGPDAGAAAARPAGDRGGPGPSVRVCRDRVCLPAAADPAALAALLQPPTGGC